MKMDDDERKAGVSVLKKIREMCDSAILDEMGERSRGMKESSGENKNPFAKKDDAEGDDEGGEEKFDSMFAKDTKNEPHPGDSEEAGDDMEKLRNRKTKFGGGK